MENHNKQQPSSENTTTVISNKITPPNIPKENSLVTIFNWSFWSTFILLATITIMLYIMGFFNENNETKYKIKNEPIFSYVTLAKISPVLTESFRKMGIMEFPNQFKNTIYDSIDDAFVPVYANIPKFADFHYSVKGSYSELIAYAKGDLSRKIQDILFEGFNDVELTSKINSDLTDTLKLMAIQAAGKEIETQHILEQEQNAFKQIIDQTIKQQVLSLRSAEIVGLGAAGAASGVALTNTLGGAATFIAKRVSQKIATKMIAKLAAKKAAGVLASGAAGAAAGSFIPGLGTAVGGIIGAGVGWIAIDSGFIAVDELINRKEFESQLQNLITEQKAQIKEQVMKEMNKIKVQLSEQAQAQIQGKSPAEILRNNRIKM